jgi:peptide/nickel transport system permease protein
MEIQMATQIEVADPIIGRKARAPWYIRMPRWWVWFLKKKPLGAIGAILILIILFLAAAAPLITFHEANDWSIRHKLEAPSLAHWLGTDDYGRDLWTRMVYGAQISLLVGFGAMVLGSGVGFVIGVVSAYYGGKVDMVIQRLVDAQMAIPALILAMVILVSLGQSLFNVILALGIGRSAGAGRIVRSQALAVRQTEYALAARAMGASDVRIMIFHIMPQCVAPWLIVASAGLGATIIAEAGLSFLGLGVPPPNPSWGGMLSGTARDYYAVAPWLAIWPGVGISVCVYGFNLFGDALRDVLDPRLRGT